jgi:hypothetical protein
VRNTPYSGNITLAPYSSIVLIKTGAGTPTPVAPAPVAPAPVAPDPVAPAPTVPDEIVFNPATGSPTTGSSTCANTGGISFEQWTNVNGNDIWDIPLQNAPNHTSTAGTLEGYNLGENYGVRMRGYICPPETGNYTFYISGDDGVDLYISTDDNPANKTKIAGYAGWTGFRQFDKFKSQTAIRQVYLETGKRYYIEVLHKNGGAGGASGHVSVAWQLPNQAFEAPIPGSNLIPYETYNMSAARMSANNSVDVMAAVNPARGESSLEVYPNPFKSVATARFFANESGIAALDVYDVNGRKVQRLFNGKVDANTSKSFNLQSKGLANGVYVLRYTLNGKFLNKKVVLAK